MQFNPASQYRQLAVRSQGPVGLIVLLYDAAIQSFHAALRAMNANQIEKRNVHLNHALTVIALLQSSLDFEKGGEVALQLERFYNVFRGRVLEASIKSSPEILRDVISHFFSMRSAWSEVEIAASRPAAQADVPLSLSSMPEPVGSHWGV